MAEDEGTPPDSTPSPLTDTGSPRRPVRRSSFMPDTEELPESSEGHLALVRKLANEVIPWIVSAEKLSKKRLYVAHSTYVWSRDLLAAVSGFGISHPLAGVLTGDASLGDSIAAMPKWLAVITLLSALIWAVLKAYVTRDEGEKKATLAVSCSKEFMRIKLALGGILARADPYEGLMNLHAEIMAIVDRHVAEGSWFFPNGEVLAPEIAAEVRDRVVATVDRYCDDWEDVDLDGEEVDQEEDDVLE